MNRALLLVLGFTVVAAGCCQTPRQQDPIEPDWQALLLHGGCLTGGQDWRAHGISEGSVLHAATWQAFLSLPPESMVPFLTGRLSSTQLTEMHVCPHDRATEGEMALYILQLRLHANWVDMPSDSNVIEEARLIYRANRQKAARRVLEGPAARKELSEYFGALAESSREEKTDLARLEDYRLALRPDTDIRLWPTVVAQLGDTALFVGGAFNTPAGSYRSALLVSRDGGTTWEDTGVFRAAGEVVNIHVFDAKRAWMATGHAVEGSMGPYHIWRTNDGGKTWRRCPTELPKRHLGIDHIMAFRFSSRTHGEAVIAGSMGEKVTYRTENGGITWTETGSEAYNYEDAPSPEPPQQQQQQPLKCEVDLENDVVIVRRLDRSGEQWIECGRLPHSYELRPEPLFPTD